MRKVKIAEVFEFVRNGYSVKQSNNAGGIPITRIETISDCTINSDKFGFADINHNKLGRAKDYFLQEGDLLMTHINSISHLGKCAIYEGAPEHLIHGMNLLCLRAKRQIAEPKYLFYYFNSPYFKSKLVKYINPAVNQASVSTTNLKKLNVPLPPLPTQQKIAAILDAADLHRRKTQTLIDKYDELAQSLFLEMFGDLEGPSDSLSKFCLVNPGKSEIKDLDKDLMVSFLPMSNVSEKGKIDLSIAKPLKEVWNGFTYFREDDVVFAKITPCMENGKGAITRNLVNSIGFGTTEFHVLRPIIGISTAEWLYHLTMRKSFRKKAEANMTGSAGQKRVPKDFFHKYRVVCPPISLQNQFAQHIQAIEAQKAQAQKALEKGEELFNSLLQKAFKGEIV